MYKLADKQHYVPLSCDVHGLHFLGTVTDNGTAYNLFASHSRLSFTSITGRVITTYHKTKMQYNLLRFACEHFPDVEAFEYFCLYEAKITDFFVPIAFKGGTTKEKTLAEVTNELKKQINKP